MLLPKNQLHELETGEKVNYRVKDKSYLDWFKRKLTNHHYWLPIIVLYISFTNKTVDVCINVTTRINAPQNQVIKFNQFNMLSSELENNSTPRTLHWAFFSVINHSEVMNYEHAKIEWGYRSDSEMDVPLAEGQTIKTGSVLGYCGVCEKRPSKERPGI